MEIKKEFKNNNEYFSLEFEGVQREEIFDREAILQKINSILEQATFHDLSTSIILIREALKDYDEEKLCVHLNTNGLSISATYENTRLVQLDYSLKSEHEEEAFRCSIDSKGTENYVIGNKINDKFITVTPDDQEKAREIVESYKKLSIINHDDNFRKLKVYYEAFYAKKMELYRLTTRMEIQCMVYILNYFGIAMDDYFDFSYSAKSKIPTSNNLTRTIEACANKVYKEDIKVSQQGLDQIVNIGKNIRRFKNMGYALYQMVRVIYAMEYDASAEQINEFYNIHSESADDHMKTIKHIKSKTRIDFCQDIVTP